MPLIPARLEFAADGTPWSEEFGDVYHSAAGGPAQARHVFLAGNRLPERWAGRERFVILETGFGFGLNFLATWQAWRRDPARCGRLHFVSLEKHPFTLSNLRVLHSRYPEFENEAAQLHACWPMLVPGAHRLELDAGRVVLTLFFSDIKLRRDLRRAGDAIYLDGFSPARNPDMWSHALLRAVSRLAGPGATAATWSVAAPVRGARIRRLRGGEIRGVRQQAGNASRAVHPEGKSGLNPREKCSRDRRRPGGRGDLRAAVRAGLASAAHGALRNTIAGGLAQPFRQLPSARYARRQRFRAADEGRFFKLPQKVALAREPALGPLRRAAARARREGRGLAARLDRRARPACRVRAVRDGRGGG